MTDPKPADCQTCGLPNVAWFTDDAVWDEAFPYDACRFDRCPRCFVLLADVAGVRPVAWRLIPEWPRPVES